MNQTDHISSSFLDLTTLRMLQSHKQDKYISVQNSVRGAGVRQSDCIQGTST